MRGHWRLEGEITGLVIYITSHGPVLEDDVGMRKSRSKKTGNEVVRGFRKREVWAALK